MFVSGTMQTLVCAVVRSEQRGALHEIDVDTMVSTLTRRGGY